jgi:regulator of protease activity HflC (stomatin/prohibitin superfamily)
VDVLIVGAIALAVVVFVLAKTAIVVPQQQAYIVERLGQYSKTLHAGLHILVPFIEKVSYRHNLKEQAFDIAEQVCITKDNVQVGVDGILYLKVVDPQRASYGIADYIFAIAQLAQTTLRSEFGKIELDRSFEERDSINGAVVTAVDKASDAWGVKVFRYEIKNINPPREVLGAMEKQMKAEREKRARILESEGMRDAEINKAEGEKQRVIKESEAKKQQNINEAEGEAQAILAVATATAQSLQRVAQALTVAGGDEAMKLRIAEQYIAEFGNLARQGNTFVLPANLTDIGSMIALATGLLGSRDGGGGDGGPRGPEREIGPPRTLPPITPPARS